jgi:hypothetical protein
MKFRVTMKDPDALDDPIDDAVKEAPDLANLPEDEREILQEHRKVSLREIASRWFEYGEYLTVEIDTDAKTCTVVEAGS